LVFLNNSPASESDYKSTRFAHERYEKARSAEPQEQQWLLQQGFGALRSSYESFIIFELFAGVVQRFEERVSFGALASVSLHQDIVAEVINRMEGLSRHIDAHLHSDSFSGEKPTPLHLLQEIDAFESLRKRQKQAKKAVQPRAAAQSAAAATDGGGKPQTPATTMTPEGIELDRRSRVIDHLRDRN
jgi:hypothetical protein